MKNYVAFLVSLFWVGPFLLGQYQVREKLFVEKGDVFLFENKVVFDCWMKDSSCLITEYEIKQFLDLHAYAVFEISYHTDSRGSDDRNLQNTERYAQKLNAFLIEKGVDSNRVLCQGWGEKHPAYFYWDKDSIPRYYFVGKDRPTIQATDKIIHPFKRKDAEKYELLHRVNRRIEVKVVEVDSLRIEDQLLHELRCMAVFNDPALIKNKLIFPLHDKCVFDLFCTSLGEGPCGIYTRKYGEVIVDSVFQTSRDLEDLFGSEMFKLLRVGPYKSELGNYSFHAELTTPSTASEVPYVLISLSFEPTTGSGDMPICYTISNLEIPIKWKE